MQTMLFLDDCTKRIESARWQYEGKYDLTVVTNTKECLRYLCRQEWDILSLDHDLGGVDFQDPDDKTSGMEVVRYIAKTAWPTQFKIPEIWVHSSNLFAANQMINLLIMGGIMAFYRRFEYDNEKKWTDGKNSEQLRTGSKWDFQGFGECKYCGQKKTHVDTNHICRQCFNDGRIE